MMTAAETRTLVQNALTEYGDNECSLGELMQGLQWHHGNCAQMYVRTQDNEWWQLADDIRDLMQDVWNHKEVKHG